MQIDLNDLSNLSERSKAFQLIKAEIKRRGYWKNKDRGTKPPVERQFSRVDIHKENTPQVNDDFTDGI
jgi:hypothetical protein